MFLMVASVVENLLMSYNSNLHLAVARMDIAATDKGDGKPLTNGIIKEEVRIQELWTIFNCGKFQPKGLPYTAEQWAPNNPDGEGLFLFLVDQYVHILIGLE